MLLRLDSSADARRSRSREVTEAFARAWTARGPEYAITHRDLVRNPVPHVTDSALHWAKDLRTPDEKPVPVAETVQQELLDELGAADVLLVGAPLYNYTMPSTLKAWIDQVHVLGVTAPFGDKQTQPYQGKPAVIVASQVLFLDYDRAHTGLVDEPAEGEGPWRRVDRLGKSATLVGLVLEPESFVRFEHVLTVHGLPEFRRSIGLDD